MIHNNIKITVKSSNENEVAKKQCCVGVTTLQGTVLRGRSMRKVESHWSTETRVAGLLIMLLFMTAKEARRGGRGI